MHSKIVSCTVEENRCDHCKQTKHEGNAIIRQLVMLQEKLEESYDTYCSQRQSTALVTSRILNNYYTKKNDDDSDVFFIHW